MDFSQPQIIGTLLLLVGAGVVAWRLNAIDGYALPAGEGETSFGAWLKSWCD